MPSPKFAAKREQFATRAQNAQEQGRADLARALNRAPFLSPRARLITVAFPNTSALVVRHGLGVKAHMFPISGEYASGNATVVRESTDQTGIDTANQLRLVASAAGTLDLWFYPASSGVIPSGATQSP